MSQRSLTNRQTQQRKRAARCQSLHREVRESVATLHSGTDRSDSPSPRCCPRGKRARANRRKRRWTLEVATIFRRYAHRYRELRAPILKRHQQRDRALRELQACYTPTMGGHRTQCDSCQRVEYVWNACKNRNCPKCSGPERRKWYEARREEILPVVYHHLVFTLPWQLGNLAEYNDTTIYDMLFAAAADALLYVGKHWAHLKAQLGFTAVLHTWNSLLLLHPHVHILVPAGGLSFDGAQWISMPEGFRFPKDMLRSEFRKRFLKKLKKAYRQHKLKFYGRSGHLENPQEFERLIKKMETCYWNIEDRPIWPERGETVREAASRVVAYLARYVRRTAISNDRLIAIENDEVVFWYKDTRDEGKKKIARVPVIEFMDRFLQHVLPRHKRHVRNFGYLSSGKRVEALELLGTLFEMGCCEEEEEQQAAEEPTEGKEEKPHHLCPHCEEGTMISVQEFPRPTVHEIMQMTLEEIQQPRLPFT